MWQLEAVLATYGSWSTAWGGANEAAVADWTEPGHNKLPMARHATQWPTNTRCGSNWAVLVHVFREGQGWLQGHSDALSP